MLFRAFPVNLAVETVEKLAVEKLVKPLVERSDSTAVDFNFLQRKFPEIKELRRLSLKFPHT